MGHGDENDDIPRLGVLGDTCEEGLGHEVVNEEGALGVGLEPDEAACLGPDEVECVDGKPHHDLIGNGLRRLDDGNVLLGHQW